MLPPTVLASNLVARFGSLIARIGSVALCVAGCGASAARSPAQPTHVPVDATFNQTAKLASGKSADFDVYCPRTTKPSPGVVLALDAGTPRKEAADLARHIASYGFVVVVPEFGDRATLLRTVKSMGPRTLPRGCHLAKTWSGVGFGEGATLVSWALSVRGHVGGASLVLVDAVGVNRPDNPCVSGDDGDSYCRPRVLLLETSRGSCGGVSATADLFGRAYEGHPRARGVAREASACDALGVDASTCQAKCGVRGSESAVLALRRQITSWLTCFGVFEEQLCEAIPVERLSSDLSRVETRLEEYSPPSVTQLSAALTLGAERLTEEDWGFAGSLRPEMIFLRTDSRSFGLGPYAELGLSHGRGVFGGGATVVVPLGGVYVLAPSGGVYTRRDSDAQWSAGALGGGFFGLRGFHQRSRFDLAMGIRVDGRFPFDGDRQRGVSLQLQVDLAHLMYLAWL